MVVECASTCSKIPAGGEGDLQFLELKINPEKEDFEKHFAYV